MSSNFINLKKGIRVGLGVADPMDGQNGDIYYNQVSNKFRKYEAGMWSDLDTQAPPSSLNFHEFVSTQENLTPGPNLSVGSGTWEVPVGVEQIIILAVGGGSGGGGARASANSGSTSGTGGGGGGAGAPPQMIRIPVEEFDELMVQLGVGGVGGGGGSSGNANGAVGANGTKTTIIGLVGNNLSNPQSLEKNGINLGFVPNSSGGGSFSAGNTGANGGSSLSIPTLGQGGRGGNGGVQTSGATASIGFESNAAPGGNGGTGGPNLGSGNNPGGGGGGGGGGGSLARGGHGAKGMGGSGRHYDTLSASRSNNVVTIQMANTRGYGARNFNVGEYIHVRDLTSSYNGLYVITAVPTNLTLQYENVGPDEIAPDGIGRVTAVRSLSSTALSGGRGVNGRRGSGGGGGGGAGGYWGTFSRGGGGGSGGDGYVIIIY